MATSKFEEMMNSFVVGIIGMGDMGKIFAVAKPDFVVSSNSLVLTPLPPYDDLSAFGSSIVFSWLDYHSGTSLSRWLSLMKNLSYLILHCLNTTRFLQASTPQPIQFSQANELYQGLRATPPEPFADTRCRIRVNACDKEERYQSLCEEFAERKRIKIFPNGHLVSRASDYIIYNVEAASIDKVASQYGPSTKQGAIVGGQTSCKAPEIAAFEKHLPEDVEIISCHSLHGPNVDPRGQPLVLIQHRASQSSFNKVEHVLSCLGSTHVYLSAAKHDRITADTQAVTHAAFLSMGKAWHANQQFPWEIARYVGGIENVKINLTLRIYSQKWHVYAGLAILNPYAKEQISQYAQSVTDLYKLMLGGHREELERRIKKAGANVFGAQNWDHDLLLKDDVLDRFSLGKKPETPTPNNHLSLLAMVDCWSQLGIVPYDHMICSTPLFRLWLGVTEYLFRKPALLDDVIRIAIEDNTFRSDDLEFTFAARGWSDCVRFGDFESYKDRFLSTQKFFEPRFADATMVGNEMMKTILENTKK